MSAGEVEENQGLAGYEGGAAGAVILPVECCSFRQFPASLMYAGRQCGGELPPRLAGGDAGAYSAFGGETP